MRKDNMKAKRIFGFDFIRAIATITIVILHYNAELFIFRCPERSDLMIFGTQFSNIYLGAWGVSLFFILSGASLMHVYGNSKFKLFTFYKKRFFSIYPMFWIAYAFGFLLLFWENGNIPFINVPKSHFLLTIIGFDGNLSPVMSTFYILGEWFLGCIIAMYVVFPILLWLIKKHPIILAFLLIGVFCCMEFVYNGKLYRNYIFLTRLPEFCFGMYFVKYMKFFNKKSFVLTLFCVAIVAVNWIIAPKIIPSDIQVFYVGVASFIALMYVSKFFEKSNLIKSLSGFFSKYSYAIFLVHHVVILQISQRFDLLTFRLTSSIALFLICFVITLILAVLLYKLEKCIMSVVKNSIDLYIFNINKAKTKG